MLDRETVPAAEAAMRVVLLCDDFLFASRVTGTAQAFGIEARVCRSASDLCAVVENQRPTCIILDLSNPGLRVTPLVAELKALQPLAQIVAYGSHVDVQTLQAARDAGCDRVLTRSQFVEQLPQRLPEWVRG